MHSQTEALELTSLELIYMVTTLPTTAFSLLPVMGPAQTQRGTFSQLSCCITRCMFTAYCAVLLVYFFTFHIDVSSIGCADHGYS